MVNDAAGGGNGIEIVCQVSQASDDDDLTRKIARLKRYKDRGRVLLYFGLKDLLDKDVRFVNVQEVFDEMATDPVYSKMVDAFLEPPHEAN